MRIEQNNANTLTKNNKIMIAFSIVLTIFIVGFIFIVAYIYDELEQSNMICNGTNITNEKEIKYIKNYYNYEIIIFLIVIAFNCSNVYINMNEHKYTLVENKRRNTSLIIGKTIFISIIIIISTVAIFNINCEYESGFLSNIIPFTLIFPYIYAFMYLYMVIIKSIEQRKTDNYFQLP